MPRRLAARLFICLLAAGLPALWGPGQPRAQTAPGTPPTSEQPLSLYGVPLKNADAESFLAAARAAGGRPLPGAPGSPPVLDMRGAGVPALERFTLLTHEGKVAQVQFEVKGYGQDNVALRELLQEKYGAPLTVSPRPLRFGGFAVRAAPRGGYQWVFADGMKLVYEHPRLGSVTLSYIDEARLQALTAGNATPGTPASGVRDRF